jgi:hypothetical protein
MDAFLISDDTENISGYRPKKKRRKLENENVLDCDTSQKLCDFIKKATATCNDKYMSRAWKLRDFYNNTSLFVSARFQRSIRWKRKNRLALWRSLKEGVSPGCLTVWNENQMGNHGVHIIIDGQQRIGTLRDMYISPCTYILTREKIQSTLTKLRVFNMVCDWIQTLNHMNMDELLDVLDDTSNEHTFVSFISSQEIESPLRKKYLTDIAPSIQVAMKKETNIMDVNIHMDVYFGKGTRHKMHSVYKRLNELGIQLSVFEMFAPIVATLERPILTPIGDIFLKFLKCRPLVAINVEYDSVNTFTLHEFITGLCLYLHEKFPKIFNAIMPCAPIFGKNLQERRHKWQNNCIEKISSLFLVIFGKACYTDLIDVIQWETLEQQTNMIEKICNAIRECEVIYERFEKPATDKNPQRSHIDRFLTPTTVWAHVSSFYHCQTPSDKNRLRSYLFGHAFVEVMLGTKTYGGKHSCKEHSNRVANAHYMFPVEGETLSHALSDVIYNKKVYQSSFSKATKVLHNILTYKFTIKEKMRTLDYEHIVSKEKCKEWDARGITVDRHNIGNCGLLDEGCNRAKKGQDMITFMNKSLPGVDVSDDIFFERWQSLKDDVVRGYKSARSFDEFIKTRRDTILNRMFKILKIR